MNARDAWGAIPAARRAELARYLVYGVRPGDTLWRFMAGDAFAAAQTADDTTIAAFGPIARFCGLYAPTSAYGHRGAPDNWISLRQTVRRDTVLMYLHSPATFEAMKAEAGVEQEVA